MLAESCVFGKQSQPPITCDLYELAEQVCSPEEAYLLPKLRYQFAEFLNPSSLKRLGGYLLTHQGRFTVRSMPT